MPADTTPLLSPRQGQKSSPWHFFLAVVAAIVFSFNLQVMSYPRADKVGTGAVSQLSHNNQASYCGTDNLRTVDFFTDGVCVHAETGSGTELLSSCDTSGNKCGDDLDSASACWIGYSDLKEVKCTSLEYQDQAASAVSGKGAATAFTTGTKATTRFKVGEIDFGDSPTGANQNLPCVLAGCSKSTPSSEPAKGDKCADHTTAEETSVSGTIAGGNGLQKGLVYKDKYVFNILKAKAHKAERAETTQEEHRDNVLSLGKWVRRVASPIIPDPLLFNLLGSSLLFVHCMFVRFRFHFWTHNKYGEKPDEGPFMGFDAATVVDILAGLSIWLCFVLIGFTGAYHSGVGDWTGSFKAGFSMVAVYLGPLIIMPIQVFTFVPACIYAWRNRRSKRGEGGARKFGFVYKGRVWANKEQASANVELSQRASMVRNNLDV